MYKFDDFVKKRRGSLFTAFTWRTILAMKHKDIDLSSEQFVLLEDANHKLNRDNLEWDTVQAIYFDSKSVICKSFKVAEYLEEKFPQNPLFPNGREYAKMLAQDHFYFHLVNLVTIDLYNSLDIKFKGYDSTNTKENTQNEIDNRKDLLTKTEESFSKFRMALSKTRFLEGDKLSYSDYIVFSYLKYAQMGSLSTFNYIVTDHRDPILKSWFNYIDNLNDGFPASFKP
ncbi:hypothetical protein K502DRAFT_367987 [Neoconidiobolus thromboides FSU 785]|nr:hypothetical protein K502DRAFT_367987 [Neoconidiobolus thromboides FSU 785]